MKSILCLLMALLIGNEVLAQLNPLVIGDIASGKTLVVKYDVVINNPTSATVITNQGVISGTNFASTSTNTTNTPIVSSNASLSALAVGQVTLSPPFAASITAYTASVPSSTSSVTITPTVEQANATVAINGTAVASDSPINIPLTICANTISVSVTAQDGVFSKVYSLTINRAAPPVTLIASSPLSCSVSSVTLTTSSGFTSYSFSNGATQLGGSASNVASVTAAGLYSVTAVNGPFCSSVASVSVSQGPDLTLLMYARPSTQYGTSPMSVVVDVVELNGQPTSGNFTVKISKDTRVSLSFPASATLVNNRSVQNSAWSFDGISDANYYVLTTSQSVAGGANLSFGLEGGLTAGATTGQLSLSGILLGSALCEMRSNNNADADKIEYFQQ